MTKEELQNYGHNKTTTTPERTKTRRLRQPPAHARFTHVHSRTRQFGECHHTQNNSHSTTLSLNQPLPAFAYCGSGSLFCIIGITCVFVACLPVINFSSVQVPTTGPTIQLYIACTNRITCKAKESSSILWWAPTSNERNIREKNLIWCAMMWWWLSSAEERGERGGGGGVLRLINITCVIWLSPLPLSWNRIACPPPPHSCVLVLDHLLIWPYLKPGKKMRKGIFQRISGDFEHFMGT